MTTSGTASGVGFDSPLNLLAAFELDIKNDRFSTVATLNASLDTATAANTSSCLHMGALLWLQKNLGVADDELPALEHISASRRSVYRKVYQTWVVEQGFQWDQLTPISIDRLYHAARLIGRTDAAHGDHIMTGQDAHNAALNWSDDMLRGAAKAGGLEGEAPEKPVSDLVSVVLQRNALDQIRAFADRLTRVTHSQNPISSSAALLFGMEQLAGLNDDSLDFLWREAHGEVSEEELAQVHTVQIDLESLDEDEQENEEETDEW